MAQEAAKLAPSHGHSGMFRCELPDAGLTVDIDSEALLQITRDRGARGRLAWGLLLGGAPDTTQGGGRISVQDCLELGGEPVNFGPDQRLVARTFQEGSSYRAVGIYVNAMPAEARSLAARMPEIFEALGTQTAAVMVLQPGRPLAELNVATPSAVYRASVVLPEAQRPPETPRSAAAANPERRRQLSISIAALAVVLAAIAAAAYLVLVRGRGGDEPPAVVAATSEASPHKLEVFAARRGRDLEVTWNSASPAIPGARRGLLFVTDGQDRTQVFLEDTHLRTGRLLYVPRTNDIDLRLEVITATGQVARESLRVLGAGSQSGGRTISMPRAERTVARVETRSPQQQEPAAIRAEVPQAPAPAPPRAFSPPAQPVFAVGTARIERLPELAVAAGTGSNPLPQSVLLRTMPAPPAQEPPQPPAAQSPAAQSPAEQSPPRTAQPFIAAVPVQRTPILIPASVRAMLTGEIAVEVKVRIDERGRVTKAEPVYRPSPLHTHVAGLARAAAYLWRFTPARLGDRAVSSDYLIVFKVRK